MKCTWKLDKLLLHLIWTVFVVLIFTATAYTFGWRYSLWQTSQLFSHLRCTKPFGGVLYILIHICHLSKPQSSRVQLRVLHKSCIRRHSYSYIYNNGVVASHRFKRATVAVGQWFGTNKTTVIKLVYTLTCNPFSSKLEATHTRHSNFESHNMQSTRLDYRSHIHAGWGWAHVSIYGQSWPSNNIH